MKLVALVLLLFAATTISSARQTIVRQDAPRTETLTTAPTVWGDGKMACSNWATFARSADAERHAAWTLGYLSALAAAGERLRPVSDSYVLGWVVAYCNNHPTVTVSTATRALASDLKNR